MATTSFPKNQIKILLLEGVSPSAVQAFRDAGYEKIELHKGAMSEAELIKAIKDVHILGIRSKTRVTRKVLEAAPKLMSIGCFCIGVNQVDLKAATELGVAVFNSPFSNTRSVAELVISEIVMLMRSIPQMNRLAHEGIWQKESKNCFEVRGKVLGIIGYGHIGSQVSVLAEGMGMKVQYFDVETKLPLGNASPAKNLAELLRTSDIVTLHVPATPETKNMIGKAELKRMKAGSILLNLSRGNVVDIDALAAALKSGHLKGAAVDVFPEEPEKTGDAFSSALQNIPNVILTPHIGGSTEEAQYSIGQDVSSKLLQFTETGSSNGSHSIPAIALSVHHHTHRILHIHNNVPGVLSDINRKISSLHINILGQYLKTNESVGYVVLDVEKGVSKKALEELRSVKNTIKARVLY